MTFSYPVQTIIRSTLGAGILASAFLSGGPGFSVDTAKAKSVHGYPVCVYTSKKAARQKNRKKRVCIRFGQYRSTSNARLFRNVSRWANPYVDVKPGYSVELFTFANWKGKAHHMVKDGRTQGPIRSIRIHRRDIGGIGGYPVCLYHKRKKAGDRACFPYGEYPSFQLREFNFFDNRASYIDIKPGYRVILFRDPNFKGSRQTFRRDTKLSGKVKFNNRASSLRIVKIGVSAKPGPEWRQPEPEPEQDPILSPPSNDNGKPSKTQIIIELIRLMTAAVQEGRQNDADNYQDQIDELRGREGDYEEDREPPEPKGRRMCVDVASDDVLNVRTGPGSSYRSVGGLRGGNCKVTLTNICEGRWCKIRVPGLTGWVHTRYLYPVY